MAVESWQNVTSDIASSWDAAKNSFKRAVDDILDFESDASVATNAVKSLVDNYTINKTVSVASDVCCV